MPPVSNCMVSKLDTRSTQKYLSFLHSFLINRSLYFLYSLLPLFGSKFKELLGDYRPPLSVSLLVQLSFSFPFGNSRTTRSSTCTASFHSRRDAFYHPFRVGCARRDARRDGEHDAGGGGVALYLLGVSVKCGRWMKQSLLERLLMIGGRRQQHSLSLCRGLSLSDFLRDNQIQCGCENEGDGRRRVSVRLIELHGRVGRTSRRAKETTDARVGSYFASIEAWHKRCYLLAGARPFRLAFVPSSKRTGDARCEAVDACRKTRNKDILDRPAATIVPFVIDIDVVLKHGVNYLILV